MNGDISRDTFDARKRYAGVVMQQGRVLLDADWNEQQPSCGTRPRPRCGTSSAHLARRCTTLASG